MDKENTNVSPRSLSVKLYQIIPEEANKGILFEEYEVVRAAFKERSLSEIYQNVFDGQLDVKEIEDVFYIFNCNQPTGYAGRSMSVSDIVVFEYCDGRKTAFFCARFGFKIIATWRNGQWEEVLHYRLLDDK